jgi:hypothetical protein
MLCCASGKALPPRWMYCGRVLNFLAVAPTYVNNGLRRLDGYALAKCVTEKGEI